MIGAGHWGIVETRALTILCTFFGVVVEQGSVGDMIAEVVTGWVGIVEVTATTGWIEREPGTIFLFFWTGSGIAKVGGG